MATLHDNWLAIAIGVGAVMVAFRFLIWIWWRVPKWQMRSVTAADPKARADIEDNFRKTVGQALGGAAVLISAVVAYWQFTQQQQAAKDLLISNQVAKGFEQLAGGNAAGDDKIVMRLGGIYALQGAMNTSAQYHQPVLEALCAFVRDKTKGKTTPASNPQPATDIQAALTVIGSRAEGPGRVDLHGANLEGADLSWANLEGADLTFAHLEGANLLGTRLDGTNLSGVNLGEVHNAAWGQLARACGTDVTLPPGFFPPGFPSLKPCPNGPGPPGSTVELDFQDTVHSSDSLSNERQR